MQSRYYKLAILIVISSFAVGLLLSFVLREIEQKDITNSKLDIEKSRITQIDKQLSSLYSKTYTDSTSLNSPERAKVLEQIEFLKRQRDEATQYLDELNQKPSTELLIFVTIAGAISVIIITFFTSSLRYPSTTSNAIQNYLRIREGDQRKSIGFINWITTNEIAEKNLSGLDIKRAKILKQVYDLSAPLQDKRDEFLNLVIEYTDLKRNEEDVRNDRFSTIINSFSDSQERLKEETSRLNRQAIINLLLCFLIAFIMIGIISYTSFFSTDFKNVNDWNDFTVRLVPKMVSILSLLTIFLYFIRMYKTNIIDVKYYQNELTNIDLKLIATKAALINDDKETINKLVNDLTISERNMIISKDQSTSDLERIKLENDVNKDLLNKIIDSLSISRNGK
ncbi:hypothetical protein [Pontibacter ruber]|uniref:Uncharacterized protein n=2 Tax=Pontibacter ruber TaxID=1343895 RepID=A0ABW5CYK6_9BACT